MIEAARVATQNQVGSDVVGYIEAVTETAALGWVWRPGVNERLTVELRLDEQILARTCADAMREDLARSGIGDGRHAFALPIPQAMRSRTNELSVFVVPEGEAAVALHAPPPPDESANRLTALQRGVDMLIGSQRLMHRNLQAALLQQTPSLTTALAEIAAAQASLKDNIATFELFAIRLEEALASREAPARTMPARRGLLVVSVISSLALFGSCWAIYRIILG